MRSVLLSAAAVLFASGGCGPAEKPASRAGEGPTELTDASFKELVIDAKRPAMVDVYATWCGPCREMAPIVDELAAEFKGRALIGKLDSDRQSETCRRYGVNLLPTFLFFKNGELVDKQIGLASKAEMAARIEALLGG